MCVIESLSLCKSVLNIGKRCVQSSTRLKINNELCRINELCWRITLSELPPQTCRIFELFCWRISLGNLTFVVQNNEAFCLMYSTREFDVFSSRNWSFLFDVFHVGIWRLSFRTLKNLVWRVARGDLTFLIQLITKPCFTLT